MKRFLIALAALLAVFVCASHCSAATPLPPAPSTGWCYDSFTTPNYNGVRACVDQPPPPNDPGAYTNLVVTWLQTPPVTVMTDVTQFFNLFGHIKPSLPIQGWPGVSGATIKYQDSGARYARLRLAMPANPGTLSHFLKLVSYGTTPGAVVRMAVVPAGAPWPTGEATACFVPHAVNDQPAININPGAPNRSKCSVSPSSVVDVLVDTAPNGWIALSFN